MAALVPAFLAGAASLAALVPAFLAGAALVAEAFFLAGPSSLAADLLGALFFAGSGGAGAADGMSASQAMGSVVSAGGEVEVHVPAKPRVVG